MCSLHMLCITTKCVKSQQNYILKKGTKKRQVYALKDGPQFGNAKYKKKK